MHDMRAEHEFSDDERRLYDLMSEISEDCYYAGWMAGNEHALWDAITTGDLIYGQGDMDRELLAQVAALSVKTGRWIIWRDDADGLADVNDWGPYSISLADWSARRATRSTAQQGEAVAWAVTAPRGGIHKLSITRESAERKMNRWLEEWPDNKPRVRPLVFGDERQGEDARDAARYRWWRNFFDACATDMPTAVMEAHTADELDRAIDAAIAAHPADAAEGKEEEK